MTNYIQQSKTTANTVAIYNDINNQTGRNNSTSGDGDSWFVSYADILLLLLTFFVLLFAFSRVEGVGANEEIAEDADRILASSMEQNDSADVLVAEAVDEHTLLQNMPKPQKPMSETDSQIFHAAVTIGEGSVSVIHQLSVKNESVSSNDGIKIDALVDESSEPEKQLAEVTQEKFLMENLILAEYKSEDTVDNNGQLENAAEELAMYEAIANDEYVNDSSSRQQSSAANLLIAENVVALTVDEQLAKLSAGLTSSEVEVSSGYQSINIELNNKILFPLGEAKLLEEGEVFLNEIATIMQSNEYFASVEGHTDNTPIATSQFPSNWELSSSRATSVARYLISQGVAANRLRAIGYADTKPKVENSNDEDRARNRRVSITFHYDSDAPLS